MERDRRGPFGESEKTPSPRIEKLIEQEKGFDECFAEATQPVLLWLSQFDSSGEAPSVAFMKECLQSQALPNISELRQAEPSSWEALFREKILKFRSRADQPVTEEQKLALENAAKDRRVMRGRAEPQSLRQQQLPRFCLTAQMGRDYRYRMEDEKVVLNVPDPSPLTYRINIPDAPGELREVILNRLVQQFWREPLFQKHGFQAKILGSAKTDGLIFYLSDSVVNEALRIIPQDALKLRYGLGQPARFGQRIDLRIPGITITTNPKDEEGETLGTFGSVISELLVTSLEEVVESGIITPKDLANKLLRLDAGQWASDVLEPIFVRRAKEKFGTRLNMHNLAFIDKG